MSDEFYIGYRKQAPPKMARLVACAASAILLAVAAVALALGAGQQPAGGGRYAFGMVESFEGRLVPMPVPLLVMDDNDAALLVAQGKHGMPEYVRNAMGKHVRLDATRIERHGILMLELAGEDRFEVRDDTAARGWTPLASETVTFTGELVDTKCYLGVMNPGQGKVHRGCAAECLRGGVPPGLLVRGADGGSTVVVIAAAPGAINPQWAGRRLEVSGKLRSTGELKTIEVENLRLLP